MDKNLDLFEFSHRHCPEAKPQRVYISTANTFSTPYYLWLKEYEKLLNDEINKYFAQEICENVTEHLFTTEEDGLKPMTRVANEIVGEYKPFNPLPMVLTIDQFEQLLEEQVKEK